VAQYTTFRDFLDSLRLLLLITLAYSGVLLAWVLHNISIHRRKGPRTELREFTMFPSHDYLGAPVDLRVDCLSESEIVIDLVRGTKCYLPKQEVSGQVLLPLANGSSGATFEKRKLIKSHKVGS